MRKLIVLTAVTGLLVLGSSQPASANGERRDDDDYRVFKKIVRVLDAVVNDCDRGRGGARVVIKTSYHPKRACHYRGPRKICYLERKGHGPYKAHNNWGHAKKARYGRR